MRFFLGQRPGQLHRTKGNCLDLARCQTLTNERAVHGWTERTKPDGSGRESAMRPAQRKRKALPRNLPPPVLRGLTNAAGALLHFAGKGHLRFSLDSWAKFRQARRI